MTVLFADVVHSMDIAAAVGAERLREIMTELFKHARVVVQRYSGTVDKFTGDGIMAVFGAPVALEDHAFHACLTMEALLSRGGDGDIEAAQAALDRPEAVPMENLAADELHFLRLRALLARAQGDERRYRQFADRYRTMATSLGYHGHIAAAEAMT